MRTLTRILFIVVIVASQWSTCRSSSRGINLLRKNSPQLTPRTNLLSLDHQPGAPPTWSRSAMPSVYMRLQHQSVPLKCAAKGRPRPSVEWFKDGLPIDYTDKEKIVRGRYSLKIIDLISAFDRGNYSCVVSNVYGTLRHTFVLDVVVRYRVRPQITLGLRNQTVLQGDTLQLRCCYYSDLEAFVRWVKHVQTNDSASSSYLNELDQSDAVILQESGAENVSDETRYTIYNATLSDSGLYSCYISSSLGGSQSHAWIQVLPAMRAVTVEQFSPSSSDDRLVAGVAVLPVSLTLVMIVIILVCYIRRRRNIAKIAYSDKDQFTGLAPYYNIATLRVFEKHSVPIPLDGQWEISADRLELGEALGEGAFGKVSKALLTTTATKLTVAVKMLKDDASESEVIGFVNEIILMKSIGYHSNIIGFLGCCSQPGPLQMVVEYANCGNLRDFLRQHISQDCNIDVTSSRSSDGFTPPRGDPVHSPLSHGQLVSFTLQIARGMQYLSSKQIIHRDLACRNVLVVDDRVLKIADFGLTRIITGKDIYRRTTGGRFPVRWMSPEALSESTFSSKSDVWSFGVVLWEVFTYGSTPYKTLPIETLPRLLKEGHRLARPHRASPDLWRIMDHCWQYLPANRPTFAQLVDSLDSVLSKSTQTEYPSLTTQSPSSSAQHTTEDASVGSMTSQLHLVTSQARLAATLSAESMISPGRRAATLSRSDSQYSSWSSDRTVDTTSRVRLIT